MSFSEKLAFLMNLMSVKNIDIARALHIDPSQISRLRQGTRSAPRKPDLIMSMSEYLAQRCASDYQRTALSEMLVNNRIRVMRNPSELTEELFAWLCGTSIEEEQAGSRLRTLGRSSFELVTDTTEQEEVDVSPHSRERELRMYQGNEGRRSAMRRLMSLTRQMEEPGRILITSDESTDWLMEDSAFFQEMIGFLMEQIQRGFQIHHVLPATQTISDAFDSFSLWLPLYLTGNVQPYYYPRLRDGIYRRTLIIVPGLAAVTANSIGWRNECSTTLLFQNKVIVDNYTSDFERYRLMCRQAFNRYDPEEHADQFSTRMAAYYNGTGDCVHKTDGLSFLTIPHERKLQLWKESSNALMRLMCGHAAGGLLPRNETLLSHYTLEIISLATPRDVINGRVSYCYDRKTIYTPSEYTKQLENAIALLEAFDQYNIIIEDKHPLNSIAYVQEGAGALLFSKEPSDFAIDIVCPNTITAMWEYLGQIANSGYTDAVNKRRSLSILRERIAQFERV